MAQIPDSLIQPLNLFLEDIKNICSLDKVILFGSAAQGTYKKNSDIDLAIFSRSANSTNRLSLMTKIIARVPKYKLDLQPLVFSYKDFSAADNSFVQGEIKSKGVVLK